MWTCDDEGRLATCIGQVLPSEDVCDGIDNDCSGRVDGMSVKCSKGCHDGRSTCKAGEWSTCDAPSVDRETCNGLDDDCNGLVDDNLGLPPPCYTGPPGTLGLGICSYGVDKCVGGVFWCVNQTLPRTETCNSLDDDCDGKIDENLSNNKTMEFVFIIDNSCSMGPTIGSVTTASKTWAAKFGSQTNWRFAIVGCPPNSYIEKALVLDFSDANAFSVKMGQQGTSGHWLEPTIDCVYEVADISNPFGLSWTPGSKRAVVMFADEPPQNATGSSRTAAMAGDAMDAGVIPLIHFGMPEWRSYYQPMMISPGSQWFDIQSSAAVIEQQLDQKFRDVSCQP